jgi:hypothetical protein
MRYLAAIALALGLATALVPPASAQWVNQYGNEVFPTQPAGNGIYVDGVIHNATPPASVTMYPPSTPGSVAGGSTVTEQHNPFYGGDRN